MKYKNIVIFTKTIWNEPPRLRHQLTELLLYYGHEVVFFEKTNHQSLKTKKYIKDGVKIVRHYEPIHHQLKPFKFLVKLNKYIVKCFIKKNIKNDDVDIIINFNYDYDFLKDLFPNKKVLTIINDDFISQAKFWMKNSVRRQLESTCKKSDIVLTVSYPLQKLIKEFGVDSNIFFPWAQQTYVTPKISKSRNVVLFWGYIDHRIDWDLVEYLLEQKVKLRFIGNTEFSIQNNIEKLKKYKDFEVLSANSIEKVVFDDICCSILPYDVNVDGVKAISISNRAFQLLSYGIPLVYSDLPDLINISRNIIIKCKYNEDYINAIQHFSSNFELCQIEIKEFLEEHYAEIRYQYLFEKFKI